MTRAILEAMKTIKAKDIVPMKMALDYLACEQFAIKILHFFSEILRIDPKCVFQLKTEFLDTCHSLLKAFKNSKKVHENIFKTLCRCTYTKALGQHIASTLNWSFYLSDKIWKNIAWKYFALYLLRFYERLLEVEAIVKIFKDGSNTVVLIASIKQFIADEDDALFE